MRSRRATPLPLKKITTFFCLSYALLPILKSTKLFGSKEKNTNLLLNSNDLQQRKKKERTVKCTFSSPPNHAIVAYTPFYKGCDVAFTKYPPGYTYPPSLNPKNKRISILKPISIIDKLVYLHPKKRVWFSTCFKCDIFKPEVWFFEIEVDYEKCYDLVVCMNPTNLLLLGHVDL